MHFHNRLSSTSDISHNIPKTVQILKSRYAEHTVKTLLAIASTTHPSTHDQKQNPKNNCAETRQFAYVFFNQRHFVQHISTAEKLT